MTLREQLAHAIAQAYPDTDPWQAVENVVQVLREREPCRDTLASMVDAIDIHDEDGRPSCLTYEEARMLFKAALAEELK